MKNEGMDHCFQVFIFRGLRKTNETAFSKKQYYLLWCCFGSNLFYSKKFQAYGCNDRWYNIVQIILKVRFLDNPAMVLEVTYMLHKIFFKHQIQATDMSKIEIQESAAKGKFNFLLC